MSGELFGHPFWESVRGVVEDAVGLCFGNVCATIDGEVVGDRGEDDDGADENGGEETKTCVDRSTADHNEREGREGRKGMARRGEQPFKKVKRPGT